MVGALLVCTHQIEGSVWLYSWMIFCWAIFTAVCSQAVVFFAYCTHLLSGPFFSQRRILVLSL